MRDPENVQCTPVSWKVCVVNRYEYSCDCKGFDILYGARVYTLLVSKL